MSGLTIFTLIHVVISLVAIGSGFVVLFGLIAGKRLDGWTAFFLATTVATSVTGFGFPIHGFTPGMGSASYRCWCWQLRSLPGMHVASLGFGVGSMSSPP